jgi:hypothetical protein
VTGCAPATTPVATFEALIQLAAALNLAVLLLSGLRAPFLLRGRQDMDNALKTSARLLDAASSRARDALADEAEHLNRLNQALVSAEEGLMRREDLVRLMSGLLFPVSLLALVAVAAAPAACVAHRPGLVAAAALLGPAVAHVAVLVGIGLVVRRIGQARDGVLARLDAVLAGTPPRPPWIGLAGRS